MVIKIEIDNVKCKILDKLNINQLTVLQDVCSFEVEGSEYKAQAFKAKGKYGKGFDWDGHKKLFSTQHQTFPIGLLGLILDTFRNVGIQVELINKRKYNNSINQMKPMIANYQDRDYQTNAVISSLLNGNGIVKAATGSGKTTIAARTISALGGNSIFIVHTRDLLYQTKEAFEKLFNMEIGQIGDGIIDFKQITVATMQTLAILGKVKINKYKYDEDYENDEKLIEIPTDVVEWNKYKKTVDVVMFDEVQRICSQSAYAVRFLFTNANYAYGYSASPWRDDGSDLMIEAAFGKRIVNITASELIVQGFLVRPIITIKSLKNNIWSGKTYEQIYKSAIVENVFRNMQIINDAEAEYKLGRNTLILVTLLKHGDILEKMCHDIGIPAVFISGKTKMSKRRSTIQDMREGRAPIVIASSIADVGLDVPRLQSIVEAGAGKSSVTALQRLGRIMRPFEGKDLCYFTTYADSAPFLCSQIDKKIEIWSTEKEFIINRT